MLLLSGFDVLSPDLVSQARLLMAPPPLPPLEAFKEAVAHALEEPLAGASLRSRVEATSRVTVVLDDFSMPVPLLSHDCRQQMLDVVLHVLAEKGLRSGRVTVLVANGLSRQWKNTELADFLGVQSTASYPPVCHDAESSAQLARLGDTPEGPLEFNRAVLDADLIIYINLVSTPLHAGLYGLVSGTAGYRTARILASPQLLDRDPAPLTVGSEYQQQHERIGRLLASKVPILQLSAVLNNEVFPPPLSGWLRPDHELSRPMQVWNSIPAAVRHRAARLLRATSRPVVVLAGPPEEVAPRTLEVFFRQNEVRLEAPADVLVFGLPDQGPGSVNSAQNPILAANLALGQLANLFSHGQMLKEGGVVVFANPLTPVFDRKVHAPHQEFYENVLRLERDPLAIHERFEPYFAGRTQALAGYQSKHAFHGAHPLYAWYQCTAARKRARRIIVAHGDPRACARMGFQPANTVEDGVRKASELLEKESPSVLVLGLPPAFWVNCPAQGSAS